MHAMDASESPAAFWNQRYQAVDGLWSRDPNALLAEFVASLAQGRALGKPDRVAALAGTEVKRGWRVTVLDVSAVALTRAAERAAEEGVELDCVEADWREYRPAPASHELVVISFMHPEPAERVYMFERARDTLAPGGHLFVVGVDLVDHGRRGPPDPERLYTTERLRGALEGFDVLRCESVSSVAEHKEGRPRVVDVVATARKR